MRQTQEFPSLVIRTDTVTRAKAQPADRSGVAPTVTLLSYYLLLYGLTMLGVLYGYYFSELFFPSALPESIETVLNIGKLAWLIPLPYALMNFYSFIRYPIFIRKAAPAVTAPLDVTLYFRIVTRGKNPRLVADTVENARRELNSVRGLGNWIIEVVSDNPVCLDTTNDYVRVICVPDHYQTASGARYKGRALQYALSASTARPEDWVIHLDEETGFDADTVRAIHAFVAKENQRTNYGKDALPRIGQGVILYGKRGIVNWITTLADSIRVGDDYGRFRLQFENGKAYFGLHGSFIVINNGLEMQVGFDHGPASSITEDCYFALVAQQQGTEYEFIHAFMYEKSPFSLADFARQRRRWFGGLWLCVMSRDIPLKQRAILGTFMVLWSLSWICIVMVYINFVFPTGTPVWLAMVGGVSFFYYVSLYIIGFLRSFDVNDGLLRYIGLFILQIVFIPIYSIMEAAGVIYGLVSPPRDFFVVQKEI